MTNAEYIFGKSLGIFIVFGFLNILIQFITLIFNMVVFQDVPVNLISYFYYPVILTLPTLIFIFGLSFLFMVLFKNRPVIMIILLVYLIITYASLGNRFPYLFDFMGFNIPLMYSDFIGFGNLSTFLLQRGIYTFLGFGFIFSTVVIFRFNRLPQSRIINLVAFVLTILCVGEAINLGNKYLMIFSEGKELRRQMKVLNEQIVDKPGISVTDCKLDLDHKEETINVTAAIHFKNNNAHPVEKYIFSLNPGLEVQKVTCNGNDQEFDRNLHIIMVKPENRLKTGGTDSISISYSGSINEDACYIDINEIEREVNNKKGNYTIDKRYSFITSDYVLLTEESLWYPVAGIPYGSMYPKSMERDFVNFELKVKTNGELTALSQGQSQKIGEGNFVFNPEVPLPQLSLIIGDYEKKSITVDDIDFNIFVRTGHDFFSRYFTELREKALIKTIKDLKNSFEVQLNIDYPYKRFSLIEVPVQFIAHKRLWKLNTDTVQPEQVLLAEKGIFIPKFKSDFDMYLRQFQRNRSYLYKTQEELQNILFTDFAKSIFLEDYSYQRGELRHRRQALSGQGFSMEKRIMKRFSPFEYNYYIFPNYYCFINGFTSIKYPLLNLALGHYIKSKLEHIYYGGFSYGKKHFGQPKSDIEIANIALSKQSLNEIISDPANEDVIYEVMEYKAKELFTYINAKTGLENEIFEKFIIDFLEESRFRTVTVEKFLEMLQEKFGFDLEQYFDQWHNEKRLPRFEVFDIKSTEVYEKGKLFYQVIFNVYNSSPVDGIISAYIPLEGGGFEKRLITLEGNQSKIIGIVVDKKPENRLSINTFISHNKPYLSFSTYPFIHDRNAKLFNGERVVKSPQRAVEPGVIIVDNVDTGFSILSQSNEKFIIKFLKKNNSINSEYLAFNLHNPPYRWLHCTDMNFYGEYEQSAHYIKAGKGKQKVQWKTEIPESGKYDIYYYRPNIAFWKGYKDRFTKDFNFLIYNDDGIDEVTIDEKGIYNGWTLIGTYYLSQGLTKVILTDKTNGKLVFAYAVKWVKKD